MCRYDDQSEVAPGSIEGKKLVIVYLFKFTLYFLPYAIPYHWLQMMEYSHSDSISLIANDGVQS